MKKSSTIALRETIPIRSSVTPRSNYRDYKGQLRRDFRKRCGYCDALDEYFGGRHGAQIDHFAPRSLFPDLETVYENLVYSCPFCNRAKSNKWIGDDYKIPNNGTDGFVDPTSSEFDNHLARDRKGKVVALTKLGEYMVKNLNLRLIRHQYIWQAQKLDQIAERLEQLRPHVAEDNLLYLNLLEAVADISSEYRKYRRRANAE